MSELPMIERILINIIKQKTENIIVYDICPLQEHIMA